MKNRLPLACIIVALTTFAGCGPEVKLDVAEVDMSKCKIFNSFNSAVNGLDFNSTPIGAACLHIPKKGYNDFTVFKVIDGNGLLVKNSLCRFVFIHGDRPYAVGEKLGKGIYVLVGKATVNVEGGASLTTAAFETMGEKLFATKCADFFQALYLGREAGHITKDACGYKTDTGVIIPDEFIEELDRILIRENASAN